MGKIGAGLGTFENIGKTFSLQPVYGGLVNMAAQMAKSQAEAEKQRRKSEEEALAKLTDFIAKDNTVLTQKYMPNGKQVMANAINQVHEYRRQYPNNWMNMVPNVMLNVKDEMNLLAEQSKVQMQIEDAYKQGYIVPPALLQAYKSNYGRLDDIMELAPMLADYNIFVGENGSVSHNVQKPTSVIDEFNTFKSSKASFGEPTLQLTDIPGREGWLQEKQMKTITEASMGEFTNSMVNNPSARVTYMTNPENIKRVNAKQQELMKGNQAMSQYSARQNAITKLMEEDLSKLDKNMVTLGAVREKSSSINVYTGPKPVNTLPDESTYVIEDQDVMDTSKVIDTSNPQYQAVYNTYFADGKPGAETGAAVIKTPAGPVEAKYDSNTGLITFPSSVKGTIYGVNLASIWEKQDNKESRGVNVNLIHNHKLYHPTSKKPLGDSMRNEITSDFQSGILTDVLVVNGKMFAKVTSTLPDQSTALIVQGLNDFLVEFKPGDDIDKMALRFLNIRGVTNYASSKEYFQKRFGSQIFNNKSTQQKPAAKAASASQQTFYKEGDTL